jgi:hypothetical protein
MAVVQHKVLPAAGGRTAPDGRSDDWGMEIAAAPEAHRVRKNALRQRADAAGFQTLDYSAVRHFASPKSPKPGK